MAFSERLLGKLACPKCRGPLVHMADTGRLVCDHCKLAYPVRDNIPVLLIDEAQKL